MINAHSFNLGTFKCASLSDGASRMMPLKEVFPQVDEAQVLNAKQDFNITADEVEVGYNVLFIDTGTEKILIDAGLQGGQLVQSLAKLNIEASEIDTILVTHGDSDHVGGLENFPNARYIIPKSSWQQWTTSDSRQALIDQFIPLFRGMRSEEQLEAMAQAREHYGAEVLSKLKDRIELVDTGTELVKGIQFIDAPGHRSDHVAVQITSDGHTLLHIVDSIRHPFQIKHPWASFIDSFPEQIVETNKTLVETILANDAQLFGAHFPFPALAKLNQKAKLNKEQDGISWEWLT